MADDETLLVVRRCDGCGEELRARVRAYGADRDDAIWVADGFARTAPCPRCKKSALGTALGAAVWDGFRWWFSTFVAAGLVAVVVGAGFIGSPLAATIGVVFAFALAGVVGIRKGRATAFQIRDDAVVRVFWFFCTHCERGIVDGSEPWMTCERCGRGVHESCAMAHAASHVALTAYRGSRA